MYLIYRIAFEADKHWGAMTPEEQYRSSYILKKCLAEMPIDLYINLGDFFDTKLLLNSKSSIYAIRDFTEKVEICQARNIPVRSIKGTRGHDYDQWNAFDRLENRPNSNYRYFSTATVEETLPGLNIWYAPEENLNFTNYINLYYEMLTAKPIHLAALHGGFDVVMPSFLVEEIQGNSLSTNLVFMYQDLVSLVHGPLVAGHWHSGDEHEHLCYVGSYDRYNFGEDEVKGFCIYEYNTETEEYRKIKVPNFLAPEYRTYEVYTSLYKGVDEYKALMEAVDTNLQASKSIQIRILVRIDAEQSDMDQQIENLKFYYANERRVHFTVINKLHKDEKKKKKEIKKKLDETYGFVYDKHLSIAAIMQRFIELTTGKIYSVDVIQEAIGKYIEGHD